MSFDKANTWSHIPCFPESRILAALLEPAGKDSQGAACQVCAVRKLQPLLLFLYLDLSSHASDYKEMM